MYVHVGNSNAVEGYRDPTSDDPDLVRLRPIEGERVTELVFPEGLTLQEAMTTTISAMKEHIAEGETPDWVVSDSEGLQALLAENWGGIPTEVPKGWGKTTGADQMLNSRSN